MQGRQPPPQCAVLALQMLLELLEIQFRVHVAIWVGRRGVSVSQAMMPSSAATVVTWRDEAGTGVEGHRGQEAWGRRTRFLDEGVHKVLGEELPFRVVQQLLPIEAIVLVDVNLIPDLLRPLVTLPVRNAKPRARVCCSPLAARGLHQQGRCLLRWIPRRAQGHILPRPEAS